MRSVLSLKLSILNNKLILAQGANRQLNTFFYIENIPEITEIVQDLLNGGLSTVIELPLKIPEKQNYKVIFYSVGEFVSFDVFEGAKDQPADVHDQMDYLFDQFRCGLAVFHPIDDGTDFLITKWNKSAEEIELIKAEEILERKVSTVFPLNENNIILLKAQACWKTGEQIVIDEILLKGKHTEGWRKLYFIKIKTGDIVLMFEDITPQKKVLISSFETRREFQAIFSAMTDAVFIIDSEGRYIKFLPTSETLLYTNKEGLIGKSVNDVFEKKMADYFMQKIKACVESGQVINLEYMLEIRGEEKWFDGYLSKLNNNQLVFIARDTSDRKKTELALRESEERYRSLFENNHTAMLLIDPSTGNITAANTSASEYYGYSIEELSRIGINDLDIDEKGCMLHKIHEAPETGYFVVRHKLASGSVCDVELHTCPVLINGQKHIHIIIYDITERLKVARELKKSSDDLEEANATKSKFFNIIAHDLKDPFNAILGFSSLLHDEYDRYTEKEKKYFIQQIDSATQGTYKLLENLLQWSRSQSGKMDCVPELIDFCNVANNLVAILKTQADAKNIKLYSAIPFGTMVYACENMVGTVLRNLITNAIKFTPRGGQIIITSKKEKNMVRVDVRDSGIGIKAEHLDKLFRIDTQYKSVGTENEKGSGLGLILCREFIEKNKGQISVESVPGKGSVFSFTLPIANGRSMAD